VVLPLKNKDLPKGYRLFGCRCGQSARPGKKDVALFLSDRPAVAAGVFTTNIVHAAPVAWCRQTLKKSPKARAVFINSGCANACTGSQGMEDTAWTALTLAQKLRLNPEDILIASTGVIGKHLNRLALEKGIKMLSHQAQTNETPSVDNAVHAIMTTDTRPKTARAVFKAGGKSFTIWGCAKGAGMIHPNMATMLSVVLTDAEIPAKPLQKILAETASKTFNRVSVDGDTSTNDSLFLLANGAQGRVDSADEKGMDAFALSLHQVCLSLATQIAKDGEGATRTAWIHVVGAKNETEAQACASTVATSALFKTALHGADPNWGRILAALGRAGVPFDPNRVDVSIGNVIVCHRGERAHFSEKKVHALLKKPTVTVSVDLHQGQATGSYVTCDYSKDYIAINADYTT